MSKFSEKYKALSRKYISPAFITMLLVSLILWYLTKLSYTYTAEVPIEVNIEGNHLKINCVAEATGYSIVAHRYFKRSEVNIAFHDVQATPSVINNGNFVVNAYSLQNVISARVSDLRIISVGEIPEITIPSRQE